MTPAPEAKTKFDPVKLIGHLFSYTKHIRLMILMGALGLTSGIVYFLFSTPTYRSTSLVSVQGFEAPIKNLGVSETFATATFNRAFLNRFRAPRIQLAAAKSLGLVGDEATHEAVIPIVPQILVAPTDSRHIEVTLLAYDPDVVRNFTQAMVDEFTRIQEESWTSWRDEALERYEVQMGQLNDRIQENIESITKVEREQNLTAVNLEQQSLLEIPKKMIQTKERIALMEIIRERVEIMNKQPVDESSNSKVNEDRQMGTMVELLSLLDKFEEDTAVAVGDIINRNGPRNALINPNAQEGRSTQEVIVEPSKLEGLEPWRELDRERRILEDEIKVKSETYLPEHAVMRELNDKLSDTKRKLGAELKVLEEKFYLELTKLEENLKVLESRMPEYYEVTEKVGKSAYAYSAVASQQQMWDQARERLAEKLASISFSEDFDWVQVRYEELISIRDKVPVSPSKRKLMMISIMIGLAGALGVPTILNLFDTSANTLSELEEATGLMGIGIVPLTNQEFLEEVHRSPAQGASVPNYLLECFRVIRSNICLHPNLDDRSQVIVVTSSRPQEGKTTMAANLAWAFQSMGERTLLVDCDLRRGRVHELMKTENAPGMTRLLMGESSIEAAMFNSAGDKGGGFDAIPRGPIIAGTTEIFSQTPFENLIENFRSQYDRIILDAPPVLGLSETASLQRLADGTVLVVRSEKTGRKDVQDAITVLKKSNAHFFGFVLNAVDLSKAGNYYSYYYYSAPYYDQFGSEDEPQVESESEVKLRRTQSVRSSEEIDLISSDSEDLNDTFWRA